jgi:hypothetical protein
MDRHFLIAHFETFLPLAVKWATSVERRILREGVPLSEQELSDAGAIGVREPERVRLLALSRVPLPHDLTLRTAAAAIQFLTPATVGLTLRYGIFIRNDCWGERNLVAHELAHTAQYERLGGIDAVPEKVSSRVPNDRLCRGADGAGSCCSGRQIEQSGLSLTSV